MADGVAVARIGEVKKSTSVPVIASQRIRRPEEAEQVLREGQADLIGMARALIADPDWVRKAQGNDVGTIRLCLGDLQDCRNHLSGGLRCLVNPEVGRQIEATLIDAPQRRSRDSRRAVVVGAGPAGLECARRLAECGLTVTVFEASGRVGGQLNAVKRRRGREDLFDLVAFQQAEIQRLGVKIVLNHDANVSDLLAERADVVVIATGAIGKPLEEISRAVRESPTVVSVWDVVTTDFACNGGNVIVIDDGSGDWPMLTSVDVLCQMGCAVTVISTGSSVTKNVPIESQGTLYESLRDANVRWHCGAESLRITSAGISYVDAGTRQVIEVLGEVVVVETGRMPNNELWNRGESELPTTVEFFAVGDCLTPRGLSSAVSDALEVEIAITQSVRVGSAATPRNLQFVGSR